SRRRHTRFSRDWSSDVCSSDLGVTTLVLGNCGTSEVNVGRMFERIEQTNVAVNVATLLGQGSVRSHVMGGSFLRPPTPAELNRKIGRASCRERVESVVSVVSGK